MTTYSTSVARNESDKTVFTNPFTNQSYKRGELNISVNRDELTGAKAKEVVKKHRANIIETTHPDFPAILDPTHIAVGPFVSALGDNLFLDTVLGVGTNGVFGYNHPAVLSKLQRLAAALPGFMGAGTDFYYESRHGAPTAQALAETMTSLAKQSYGDQYMMNFANAGTESNENALKAAMFIKFRAIQKMLSAEQYEKMCEQLSIKKIEMLNDQMWSNYPFFLMSFRGAFHGRTATSNTISASKVRQKEGYQLVPYVVHVPFKQTPDFEQFIDPTPLTELIDGNRLREVIDAGKAPIDLLSAIIFEPIQGEGGYRIPTTEFLKALSDFLEKYRSRGVLLLADEVQTGMYRTGTFCGLEHWFKNYPNLKPDLISFAKPLHVGGVLVRKDLVHDWPPGKFSGTWAEGNLLAIALAYYTLEELKNVDPALGKSYPENAVAAGEYIREQLNGLADRLGNDHPGAIKNVRGIGQMNAFDVPDAKIQSMIVEECFLHGMHILGTGKQSIRLFGTVDQRKREADMIVAVLEDAIKKVLAAAGKKSKASVS